MPNIDQIEENIAIPPIDERARLEMENFISENKRTNLEKNTKHLAFVVLMWIGTIGVTFVIVTKIYHLICSHAYAWLDKDQLNNIDTFLTSGVIGGSIVGFFKSKITNADTK